MQTNAASRRTVVDLFDREFDLLIDGLRTLTMSVPPEFLYRQPPSVTVGESILRSAGIAEQTFGGITSNLWDDPFEWTLPETLSTPTHILDYLSEVDATRRRAFASFVTDEMMLKYIAVPSGKEQLLMELLLRTISRASSYRGQAAATLKMFSDVSGSGFII